MSFDSGSTSSSASGPRTRAAYLAGVEGHLGALPARDRREILDEIRSHVAERYTDLSEAEAAASVAADLGSPAVCAAAFLAEYGLDSTASPAAASRLALRLPGIVFLGTAAAALALFGLINALTPPGSAPAWLGWRDIVLGPRGWLLLTAASGLLASAAATAAVLLWRARGRHPTPSADPHR